jgi:predicted  nucleic acid-binding Zn-ribbon protein
MSALPEKLKPAKTDLAKLDAMLQMEKDRIAETEAWRATQEQLIKQDEDALRQAKLKVQAAKSTKDFAAASREVDNKRRSISEREDEVLKVIEALEKNRAEIEPHEKDVASLREEIAKEEAIITATLKKLASEAEEFSAGRDEITVQIDPVTLKRYDTVMRGRGYGVAPVVDGACQGCHMSLPPQLNNILARADSIESCPSCHRILYRQELLDADEEQAV